jgi:hypothetical protein
MLLDLSQMNGFSVDVSTRTATIQPGLKGADRYDPAVDRLIHFTNSGVIIGTDPLKARLDLWQRVWSRKN